MSAVQAYYVMYQANHQNFLHSRDAVASIIFAINNEKNMVNQCYNIGDENQITKLK